VNSQTPIDLARKTRPREGKRDRSAGTFARVVCPIVLALIALLLSDCSPAAKRTVSPQQAIVEQAKADLAEKLGIRENEVAVDSVEETTFPDASLGAPQPGQSYAQVVTPGYVIKLVAGDTVYEYHATDVRVLLVSGEGNTGDEILVIEGVHVELGEIAFRGRTLLPDGTCLLSQLYVDVNVDDQSVPWWPAETCIRVQEGQWEIGVPLGKDGAPKELDSLIQYKLVVWSQDDPSVESEFWFDLSGPPSP
jgi:hypothetical protein